MRTILISIIINLSLQCYGQAPYNNSTVFNCVELINNKADSLERIGEIEKSSIKIN